MRRRIATLRAASALQYLVPPRRSRLHQRLGRNLLWARLLRARMRIPLQPLQMTEVHLGGPLPFVGADNGRRNGLLLRGRAQSDLCSRMAAALMHAVLFGYVMLYVAERYRSGQTSCSCSAKDSCRAPSPSRSVSVRKSYRAAVHHPGVCGVGEAYLRRAEGRTLAHGGPDRSRSPGRSCCLARAGPDRSI